MPDNLKTEKLEIPDDVQIEVKARLITVTGPHSNPDQECPKCRYMQMQTFNSQFIFLFTVFSIPLQTIHSAYF
jgi:ribosomal protein L6P/L9E